MTRKNNQRLATWLGLGALLLLALGGIWLRASGRGSRPAIAPARSGPGAGPTWPMRHDQRPPAARLAEGEGTLRGRVHTPTGAGIKGAEICAQGTGDHVGDDRLGEPFCTTSGDDGEYQIGQLLPAQYDLDASASGFTPGRYREDKRQAVTLAAGETQTGLDLVLRPGGVEARGRVKDIGGGPVAMARVDLQSTEFGSRTRVRTDAAGEFRAQVPRGPIEVSAHAPGYSSASKSSTAPGATIELLLTPEAVLAGRAVRAGSGEPVAGALIEATPISDMDWDGNRSATSDADGRFRLDRLKPGRYKPRAIVADGRGQLATSVLLGIGSQATEIVIEVHRAAQLSGRVLLADGKTPCPRGAVDISDHAVDAWVNAMILPDGSFVLRGVLPGQYQATVRCEERTPLNVPKLIDVGTQDIPQLRFVLQAGQRVSGVVVNSAGEPVAHATVMLELTGGDPRAARSDAWAESRPDGGFEVEGVTAGTYHLQVHADREPSMKEPLSLSVTAGKDTTGLRVVLDPSTTLDGVVVDQDGRPVRGVDVWARSDRDGWGTYVISRDDGSFSLLGLRLTVYRLYAARSGTTLRVPGTTDDDRQGRRGDVREKSQRPVRLVVERETGSIKGRVLQGGQPVTDAYVDAERESDSAAVAPGETRRDLRAEWSRQPSATDGDGRFVIENLATPGQYTVRAFRKGGGDAIVEHVAVGSTTSLTIRATGALAGRVRSSSGASVDPFTVTVADDKEGFSRTEQYWSTSGAWRLTDLPAGRFHLQALAREGTAEADVALVEGQTQNDIDLVLTAKAKVRGKVVAFDTGKPLAGMMVSASSAARAQNSWMGEHGPDRRHVTDADGRFELDDAPAGKITLFAVNQEWRTSRYLWARVRAELRTDQMNEVAPLRVVARGVIPPEMPGSLGFELKKREPEPNDPPLVHTVAVIRPDGPAAVSGLKVGDVIVSVNGQNVTAPDDFLYFPLVEVARGTVLKLGLARGATVTIKVGDPL